MLSAMPIYEYLCTDCSDTFEELVRMDDGADVRCPGCGATAVTRLLSQFSTGRPGGDEYAATPAATRAGGCCGGSCGCGH